jgi:uncharacterized cupin superfamily protein
MSTHNQIVYRNEVEERMMASPIDPSWIIEGTPTARNFLLWRQIEEGGATAYLWDCTAGVFNWHYDVDETIYVVDGTVVVWDEDGGERTLGSGDSALFPAGSHAVWRIHTYVRKVAVLSTPLPRAIMLPLSTWKKLSRMVRLIRSKMLIHPSMKQPIAPALSRSNWVEPPISE